MATLPQWIEARVIQKIATEAEWSEITLVPYKGEVCLVGDSGGKVVNIKIGDGVNVFSDLDYMFDSIQQNVGYIAIESNALPTPLDDVAWGMVTGGTYTFGGVDVFTVPDGHWGIANYSSGAWSLVDMGELPGDPTEQEYNIETPLPLSGSAIGKGISKNFQGGENNLASAEDVREMNMRVAFFDRPDLPNFYPVLNSKNQLLDRMLSENRDAPRMLPDGVSLGYVDRPDLGSIILIDSLGRIVSGDNSAGGNPTRRFDDYTIDRPDLGAFILVDNGNRILGHSGQGNGGDPVPVQPGETQPNFAPWNPPEQDGFWLTRTVEIVPENENSRLGNYDLLIQDYDSLMNDVNVNPNFGRYVSKIEIGQSGDGGIPIYLYSFAPPQPKAKILLIGGTHAVEKMYIECIYQFAVNFAKDWSGNDFLSFLRWNVHIDVLPCRSPRTIRNAAGYDTAGVRTIPETTPIPFTWSRAGTSITLSFDTAQFPDDGYLTGDTYFNSVPATALVDKTFISVMTSSDQTALPLAIYRIGGVISGNSIIFETDSPAGATSGSGTFQVWTDPNRNPSVPNTNSWENFVPQYRPNTLGTEFTTFDNKGTRPFSLRENRALIDHCEQEGYDLIIDGHADAGDNDIRFDRSTGFNPDLERMMAETAAFNASTNTIRDYTNSPNPLMTIAMTRMLDTPFHTIEWGSGFVRADETQQRDALRWLGITVKNNIVQIINNKNK